MLAQGRARSPGGRNPPLHVAQRAYAGSGHAGEGIDSQKLGIAAERPALITAGAIHDDKTISLLP